MLNRAICSVLLFATVVVGADAPAAKNAKPPEPPRTPEAAVTALDRGGGDHGAFLARIQAIKGDCGLVLIGDSITERWSGNGAYAKFKPYKPLNLGVGGDRTEHVLYRLENGELDGIHPKAAMILIGTNNLYQFKDEKPEWTAAGVKRIVEVVKAKLPETRILLIGVLPRKGPKSAIRLRISELNSLIAKLADDRVTYIDIGQKFLAADGTVPNEVMPDGTHPSAKGYDIFLEAVQPTLAELMK